MRKTTFLALNILSKRFIRQSEIKYLENQAFLRRKNDLNTNAGFKLRYKIRKHPKMQ